MNTRGYN